MNCRASPAQGSRLKAQASARLRAHAAGSAVTSRGGIIAGNSLVMLLAWRADRLTANLLVSSVIMSVIMAVVVVLACAAPARRALRIQPPRRCGRCDVRSDERASPVTARTSTTR